MHAPSLPKLQIFSQSMTFIDHHKFAVILFALTLLGSGYVLSLSPEDWLFPQQTALSDTSVYSDEINRAFSRLDDPEYAHEYPVRVQSLYEHLRRLQNAIQADRTYIVLYRNGLTRFGRGFAPKIFAAFEIGEQGPEFQIKDFQGFSRLDWLQIKRAEQRLNGYFPGTRRNYGMELVNAQGASIGYLGIDYWQKEPAFEGNIVTPLQESAVIIQDILLQPLEILKN